MNNIVQQETEKDVKIEHQKERRKMLMHTISTLIVVAAISVLIATKFLPVLQVSGRSMEPTLEDGEIVILHKTSDVETGEIIGFYYQSKILLKRVIGTGGDYIEIDQDGNVYVNDKKLEEPYLDKDLGNCDIEFPYQVPEGKLFVLGDCRKVSTDSRNSEIGCITKEQIVGKVIFRIWSISDMKFFY